MHNVSQCHLQSHLPVRNSTHTLSDVGYMHFIIENVTGEHLQRCHNLITVCKYDTAVGGVLNTNGGGDFSCHLCTLSVNVVPVGEIAVSTTICFNIILRGYFTQEMWAARGGGQFKVLYWCNVVINITVVDFEISFLKNWREDAAGWSVEGENGIQTSTVATKSVWVKPSFLLTAWNKYFSCMAALSV